MRARFLVKMWKSGSGRSLIRDGNAICMVMGTRGENCTPRFERSSSFREPIFSPLPRSDTPPNCLTVNCVSRPTGLKQIRKFFHLFSTSATPANERDCWPSLFAVNSFLFLLFFFFFPLSSWQNNFDLGWIEYTRLAERLELKQFENNLYSFDSFGRKSKWKVWKQNMKDYRRKRERKKKKSIQKEFLGGEREGCRME